MLQSEQAETGHVGCWWDGVCNCFDVLFSARFSRHLGHLKLRRWNVLSRHFGDTWAALLLETKHVSAGCYSLDLFGGFWWKPVGFAMAD